MMHVMLGSDLVCVVRPAALVFSNGHVCVWLWNCHGPRVFHQAHAGVSQASMITDNY